MAVAVSGPRLIKRRRRTRTEVRALRDEIYQILEGQNPQSDRQVFYAMTVRGLIQKKESEYKNVTVRLLGLMREQGELPWSWIVDSTRWMHKPASHASMEEALEETRRTYRRALWDEQDAYCEIWIEKEGLAGVVYPVTAEFDVPLMRCTDPPPRDSSIAPRGLSRLKRSPLTFTTSAIGTHPAW